MNMEIIDEIDSYREKSGKKSRTRAGSTSLKESIFSKAFGSDKKKKEKKPKKLHRIH